MNPIDEMKTQADHAWRARKTINALAVPIGEILNANCPDTHKGAWLSQTLANLVSQVLFTLFNGNAEKTRLYVEAVRENLKRDFEIEDD